MKSVLLIAGPTASGKSALAVDLAIQLDGTIINADAAQLYDTLPILSAQPNAASLATAPHRLYSILDAAETANAAKWAELARLEIKSTHNLPIVIGGTGLYFRALLNRLADIPAIPNDIREAGKSRREVIGAIEFHAEIAGFDPVYAGQIQPGDTQRTIRAWEVYHSTGRALSDWFKIKAETGLPLRFIKLLVMPDKATLYAAINARFLAMTEYGALDEVERRRTLSLDRPVTKTLGYRELRAYLGGTISRERAIAAAQQATRHYAKRQATWFPHQYEPDYIVDTIYRPELLGIIRGFIEMQLS